MFVSQSTQYKNMGHKKNNILERIQFIDVRVNTERRFYILFKSTHNQKIN